MTKILTAAAALLALASPMPVSEDDLSVAPPAEVLELRPETGQIQPTLSSHPARPITVSRTPQPVAAAASNQGSRAATPALPGRVSEPEAGLFITDRFAPIASPDEGDHCAPSLSAADLTEFFADPIGRFQGADYQRAFRLPDDRVVWTFQDAFVSGTLVHNVGMIQSGRCFTRLNSGARSWQLGDLTSHMQQWQWILGGGISTDGTQLHLFVVQMTETGSTYLSRTRPTALRRVVLDTATLEVIATVEEQRSGDDLYGWDVTNDEVYTYLYSHCYQQFGYETMFGFGECVVDVRLARIPVGDFDAEREYWDGSDWTSDARAAAPVVSGALVGSGNNPAQIRFDGTQFVLVQKRDDWWGTRVDFGVASRPEGPFLHTGSVDEPLSCDRTECNTYFASWVPWRDSDGNHIWSIGHNRWNGSETHSHLADYRPTFAAISL